VTDTETTEAPVEEEAKPKRRRKTDTDTGQARQYPDQKGLRQIETKRRERGGTSLQDTKSFETRERTGWKPQEEPSGVFPSWHEDHYDTA